VSIGLGVGNGVGSDVGIGAIVSKQVILKLHSYLRLTSVHAQPYACQNESVGGISKVPYP